MQLCALLSSHLCKYVCLAKSQNITTLALMGNMRSLNSAGILWRRSSTFPYPTVRRLVSRVGSSPALLAVIMWYRITYVRSATSVVPACMRLCRIREKETRMRTTRARNNPNRHCQRRHHTATYISLQGHFSSRFVRVCVRAGARAGTSTRNARASVYCSYVDIYDDIRMYMEGMKVCEYVCQLVLRNGMEWL